MSGSGDSSETLPTRTALSPGTGVAEDGDTVEDEREDAEGGLARGSSLGRYVVLDRVGKGGMGVVYRAYDPELERSVAIKLMRVGKASEDRREQARSRLLREAQALAKLNHPNVIAVHDVGTFHGDVFIAMELVEGRSVARWLKEEQRSRKQILELFVAAGRGLAAAHDAGLIHRDFKPNNLIIGDDGRLRVLDFGLAKAVELSGSEEAEERAVILESPTPIDTTGDRLLGAPLTQAGTVLGTPKYMAPEQLTGRAVDERTDQFSFCIALYEALYGERPFAGATMRDLALAVTSGKVRAAPGGRRVPAWLRRVLLRGLSPHPDDRYPSMHELLAALGRDPGLRRRRVAGVVGVAALAGAALFGLFREQHRQVCQDARDRLAGVWDEPTKAAVRERFVKSGRPYAEDSYQEVVKLLDRYTDRWVAMHTEACVATHVRGDQSAQLLDLRMGCLDRQLHRVQALAQLFARQADAAVVDRAVEAASQLGDLEVCADDEFLTAAIQPPVDRAARARVDDLRRRLDEVSAQRAAGHYQQGRDAISKIVAEARQLVYPPVLAEALLLEGTLAEDLGDLAAAEAALDETITVAAQARDDRLAARAWNQLLWVVCHDQARYADAPTLELGATAAVARAGGDRGLYAALLNAIAAVPYGQGKYREALGYYQRVLKLREGGAEPNQLEIAAVRDNIGLVYDKLGEYQEARRYHEQALALREQALGRDHPLVASTLNNLGINAERQGRFDDARKAYERSLAIKEKALGADHPGLAGTINNLGNVYYQKQEYDLAVPYFERAVKMKERLYGPDHPRVGLSLDNLAAALIAEGKHREAVPLLQRSLAISEKALGADHPDVAYALTSLGEAYLGLGQPRAAVEPLERALRLRRAAEVQPGDLAETRSALARALWASGRDRGRARRLAHAARDGFEQAGPSGEPGLAVIRDWLAGIGER